MIGVVVGCVREGSRFQGNWNTNRRRGGILSGGIEARGLQALGQFALCAPADVKMGVVRGALESSLEAGLQPLSR